jgi:hypothetical protein
MTQAPATNGVERDRLHLRARHQHSRHSERLIGLVVLAGSEYTLGPLPSLDPQRRRGDRRPVRATDLRCRQCGNRLELVRTHTSPVRLGPSMVTEYYRCEA